MWLVVTEGYSIAIDNTIVEGFAYLPLLCHSNSTKNSRTKTAVVEGNIAPKVSLTVWQLIGSSDSSDRFGQVRTEPVRFSPF